MKSLALCSVFKIKEINWTRLRRNKIMGTLVSEKIIIGKDVHFKAHG